jgi:hypothetical protein
MHQREQRERLGDGADGVLREERGQPDGLVAELATDRVLRVRGEIALVEQQVEHRRDARQSAFQRVERWRFEIGRPLAQPVTRPRQALVDVRLGREQPQRDLRGAESTQGLQRQDQPRVPGDRVVAADEEHAEHVILHLACEIRRGPIVDASGCRVNSRMDGRMNGLLQNPEPIGLPAQIADQVVAGHAIEPRAGVVGKASIGPRGERGQQRALDCVLYRLEMTHARLARQQRHEPAVFVPEVMLDQSRCRGGGGGGGRRRAGTISSVWSVWSVDQGPATSRISMLDPGITAPGHSLATSIARSILSAETNM